MNPLTQGTSIKLKNSETTGTIVGLGPEIAGQAYYIIETDKQCLDSKYPYSHFCASSFQIDVIEKNVVDPSDEELSDLWSWAAGQDRGPWPTQQHCFARAILSRWGRVTQPATFMPGDVEKLVTAVQTASSAYGWVDQKQFLRLLGEAVRLADVIEEGCDCSIDGPINYQEEIKALLNQFKELQSSTPTPGEVEKLVKWLKEQAIVYQDYLQSPSGSKSLTRTAELLEKYADLAEDAVAGMKYIESTYGRLYGVGWDRVYTKAKLLSNTEETTND